MASFVAVSDSRGKSIEEGETRLFVNVEQICWAEQVLGRDVAFVGLADGRTVRVTNTGNVIGEVLAHLATERKPRRASRKKAP